MAIGTCKLCLKETELQESHYIPAALYPKNSTLEYTSEWMVTRDIRQITSPLLCRDCEQLFSRHGESEVLTRIAPKLARKSFPLHERLRVAWAREDHPDLKRFDGRDIGLDMDRFAYFMISLIWRGAVHRWMRPDGAYTTPLPIPPGQLESIRHYLLNNAELPNDIAVLVIVCNDELSRKTWFAPGPFWEADCLNFRFHAFGVIFRALLGPNIPKAFRAGCCTSARKCLFYGDCERRTRQALQLMEEERARQEAGEQKAAAVEPKLE